MLIHSVDIFSVRRRLHPGSQTRVLPDVKQEEQLCPVLGGHHPGSL